MDEILEAREKVGRVFGFQEAQDLPIKDLLELAQGINAEEEQGEDENR